MPKGVITVRRYFVESHENFEKEARIPTLKVAQDATADVAAATPRVEPRRARVGGVVHGRWRVLTVLESGPQASV